MNKPRFRSHFRVERLAPDLVFLLSEQEQHTLTGRMYYLLAPLLDGQHDLQSIVAFLADDAPPLQIHYTLARLEAQGYLVEGGESPTPQAAFWEQTRLQTPKGGVQVVALGSLSPDALLGSLDVAGLIGEPVLDVLLVEDYLDPALADWNAQAERPFMLVKPMGVQVWIGPVIEPHVSACWACLAQRLRLNRSVESFLERHSDSRIVFPPAALSSTFHTAISLATSEIAYWLAGERRLRNRLFAFDTQQLTGEWHTLIRRPQCAACGDPRMEAVHPIRIQSRPKRRGEGGHRSDDALVTWERYRQHISPITGVVPYVRRIPSAAPLHVFASGHNKARSFQHWQNLRQNLRSQSAGKGTSELQAQVGALAEAVERYSGLFLGTEPRQWAAYTDRPDAIHPHDLLLYSDRQYAEREIWNRGCPPHLVVPPPFDEHHPIDWTPVWSLRDGRIREVPTALCYYDYVAPDDYVFCGADSNGCAAGSSLEDAILQGFFELVERDAVAIWWYNRLQRPVVDLESLDHSYVRQVLDYFATLERELWLLDLTTDLGIPAFAAVSRRLGQPTEDVVLGFGAHFEPQIAALRAITELNQVLPAVLRDANGHYRSQSPWEITWWQTATIANQPYLTPDPAQSRRTMSDFPVQRTSDLHDDLAQCLTIAQQAGLDVLVLDQTRPDVGMPVVRVIVPGLRHFWGRFAPGRLYKVPVRLGWLDQPRAESDLNPNPMFM